MKHNVVPAFSIALVVAASFVAGCGDKDAKTDETTATDTAASAEATPAEAPAASAYPGTEDGAKALLAEFVKPGADYAALSKPLQPTTDDYKAIFADQAFAAKADAMYTPVWSSGELVIKPNEGQTEVRVTPASVADLKAGTGNAEKFPGGYKDVADKYNDGLTIYRFEFLAPGEDAGMAFDGLTYVNGNWRIVPKPWRANETPS